MKNHRTFRRLDAALICGLILSMLTTSLAGFGQRCEDIRQEVLRLHILANSDSEADQAVKLLVRDAVLDQAGELFSAAGTLEEAEKAAERQLSAIEETARRVIRAEGYSYPVKAELTRMYFDTRDYGGTILPAGEYQAVRLTLGEAAGKNWWCVMFPPICVPAAGTEGSEPSSAERGQAMEDIRQLNEQPRLRLSFAFVEWLEGWKDQP